MPLFQPVGKGGGVAVADGIVGVLGLELHLRHRELMLGQHGGDALGEGFGFLGVANSAGAAFVGDELLELADDGCHETDLSGSA